MKTLHSKCVKSFNQTVLLLTLFYLFFQNRYIDIEYLFIYLCWKNWIVLLPAAVSGLFGAARK